MANYKLNYSGEKIDELLTKIDNLGTGTDTKSGTVKLSSATDSNSGVSDGVAATPSAVSQLKTDMDTKANKTDVLTYEEIQASTDLSGKIASASALKTLKSSLGVLDVTSFKVGDSSSIDISLNRHSCYLLIGVHAYAGTWCRALNSLTGDKVIINIWNFGNVGESYFNVVSKDYQTCTLTVGGVGQHVSCFLIRLGKVI